MIELTITIKGIDRKLSREWLLYDPITLDINGTDINNYIQELRDEFKEEVEDIRIRTIMVIK